MTLRIAPELSRNDTVHDGLVTKGIDLFLFFIQFSSEFNTA